MAADLTQPLGSLPDPLPITPIRRPFDITVRPPGSKSLTNRALLLAALAEGTSTLRGALLDADDARVMIRALEQLGARIERVPCTSGQATGDAPDVPGQTLRIAGVSGRWRIAPGSTVSLDLHNAGTATRFLTAAAMLAPAEEEGNGGIVIDGDARMRERPIGELVDALRGMNVRIDYLGRPGFPPLLVHPLRSLGSIPGTVRFGMTTSSQFISAVLLVAPFLPKGLRVVMPRVPTSEPYIGMTVGLLTFVGLNRHPGDYCSFDDLEDPRTEITIRPHPLKGFEYDVEPDASGATYFEAAAALVPGARVTIAGLDLGPRGNLQGDTRFVRVLTEMGAMVERVGTGRTAGIRITGPERLRPIDADLADMPDTAMTAAVLCCFAAPTPANPAATSTLRGLRTLRVKETDRLEALRTELTRLGARVEIFTDGGDEGLRITPPDPAWPRRADAPPLVFETYKDHRMAMALALAGLRVPGVAIRDPGCVGKTYPAYWAELRRLDPFTAA